MIFGDPGSFAIQMDVVNNWSSPPSFIEGVVNVYIRDVQLGDGSVFVSSIFDDFRDITDGVLASPPVVEEEEFFADVAIILPKILKARHPWSVFDSDFAYENTKAEWFDSVNEDLTKDATFETLMWMRYKIFAIKFDTAVRVMIFKFDCAEDDYLNLSNFDYSNVMQEVVSVEYLNNLVSGIRDWYLQMQHSYAGHSA